MPTNDDPGRDTAQRLGREAAPKILAEYDEHEASRGLFRENGRPARPLAALTFRAGLEAGRLGLSGDDATWFCAAFVDRVGVINEEDDEARQRPTSSRSGGSRRQV